MNNFRIQKFTSTGELVTKWGSFGLDDKQFDNPIGIAMASDGSVYVADMDNHRIQKFSVGQSAQYLCLPIRLLVFSLAHFDKNPYPNLPPWRGKGFFLSAVVSPLKQRQRGYPAHDQN